MARKKPNEPQGSAAQSDIAQEHRKDASAQRDSGTPKKTRVRRPGEHMTEGERADAKEQFLEAYCQGLSITASCKAAHIARSRLYEWLEHDEAFSVRYHQAKEAGDDALRDEIRRRAVEGWDEEVYQLGNYVGTVHKYSDTLLIFQAKARMPEYRDKVDVKATVQGTMTHDLNIAQDAQLAATANAFLARLTALRSGQPGSASVSGE